MAGRRKRGSTSSVASSNGRPIQWCHESSVLLPVRPGTSDDNLPIFELADAVVMSLDGERLENALDILFKGPFLVRGHMIVDDKNQRRRLVKPVESSVPVEISPCIRYSVGEADDDDTVADSGIDMSRHSRPPVLWMGGRSAWFEINPSKEYLPLYREICDTIRMYYAVLDLASGAKIAVARSRSIDPADKLSEVFLRYTMKVGNGLTIEEAMHKCHQVAPFFISQFVESELEAVKWQGTLFYEWMIKEHADLLKKAQQALRKPKKIAPSSTLSFRNKRGTSEADEESLGVSDSQEAPAANRSRRCRSSRSALLDNVADRRPQETAVFRSRPTRSQSTAQNDDAQPADTEPQSTSVAHKSGSTDPSISANNQSPFQTVLATLENAYDELSGTRNGVTNIGLFNKVYFNNRFPTYRNGQKGCHRIPVEEVFHYNATALLDSLDPSRWDSTEFWPWLQKMAVTKFEPLAIKPSDFPFRVAPRKSMRPVDSREHVLGMSSQSVVRGDLSHVNEDEASDQPETPRRIGKGVKTPGRAGKSSLRPMASTKKRPHADLESDLDESSSGRAKRSHYFSDADDDAEAAIVTGNEDHDEEEDNDQARIVLRAEQIPSTVPRGPSDTWTCDQDECDYIVRGGDAEECQERIRQHFEEHEQRMERVQLAMNEGSRGHLPISHLLDKIKKLGEQDQKEEQLSLNGASLPRRIQRKVIV